MIVRNSLKNTIFALKVTTMGLSELKFKWTDNIEYYKSNEIGTGVHSFVKDVISSTELFSLTESPTKKNKTFIHDNISGENGRPDFMLYISSDITIPVEVKKYMHIQDGEKQLSRYQLANNKQYGILTDGGEWRFYKASQYKRWKIEDILNRPVDFAVFWSNYTNFENYYLDLFTPKELFHFKLNLNDPECRAIFFEDTTKLIGNFKSKMRTIGVLELDFTNAIDKKAVETSYSYLIQFILYKVLVDNQYKKFQAEYDSIIQNIETAILEQKNYRNIILEIRNISEYISRNIYKPFKSEQEQINEKLISGLQGELTIDDIAPWLDIILYINKYDFANLRNEIFGFIYENYLKDLYQDENKGQYFTDPAVVDFMLSELGYTSAEIKNKGDDISIIDPSCGAGTFLYSAVDRIIETWDDDTIDESLHIESLVDQSVFGLDIEEFPLYLAEMSILMRLLPLIVNDNYENPIDEKLKLFKTNDSISEFAGTCLTTTGDHDLFSQSEEKNLGYKSFMRDERDLQMMLESMQATLGKRQRFDYVVGNPPYIGYNECCKQGFLFTKKIKDKNDSSITLGNVFGVNLHSIPNHPKKYRPNPNLYSFFCALGLGLLKDGGRICYIIPQTILTAGDLDVLRYHLSNYTIIDKIITFEGNLFIGRGLKQKRPIATSSLIFVATKAPYKPEHIVEVVNYKPYSDKKGVDFGHYLRDGARETRQIPQSQLRLNVDNWNFIKHDDVLHKFTNDYYANNEDIAIYYDHKIAVNLFKSLFWFDGGYGIDEKQIKMNTGDYIYPKTNNNLYNLSDIKGYWDNIRSGNSKQIINLRQGNQGYNLLDSRYKIVWSYANAKKFFFTDKPVIWARNQYNAIGSDNKMEMLYLLALLNSPVNKLILKANLKTDNEKDFLISGKSIKQFIRVPKITPKNKKIKDKIIELTDRMLDLESVRLKEILDFKSLYVQRFDNIRVEGSELILTSGGKKYCLAIPEERSNLVNRIVNEAFYDSKAGIYREFTLSELKQLPAIDFEEQAKIKARIDSLVYTLYDLTEEEIKIVEN